MFIWVRFLNFYIDSTLIEIILNVIYWKLRDSLNNFIRKLKKEFIAVRQHCYRLVYSMPNQHCYMMQLYYFLLHIQILAQIQKIVLIIEQIHFFLFWLQRPCFHPLLLQNQSMPQQQIMTELIIELFIYKTYLSYCLCELFIQILK